MMGKSGENAEVERSIFIVQSWFWWAILCTYYLFYGKNYIDIHGGWEKLLLVYLHEYFLPHKLLSFSYAQKAIKKIWIYKTYIGAFSNTIIVFFLSVRSYLQFSHYLRIGEALSAKKENCSTVKKKKHL